MGPHLMRGDVVGLPDTPGSLVRHWRTRVWPHGTGEKFMARCREVRLKARLTDLGKPEA